MFCIDSYGVLYSRVIWVWSILFPLTVEPSVLVSFSFCWHSDLLWVSFSLCVFCVPVSSTFDLRLSVLPCVKLTIVSHSDVSSCFILVTVLLFVWRCVYFPHLIIPTASSCASYLLCIRLLSCACIYCLYLISLSPLIPMSVLMPDLCFTENLLLLNDSVHVCATVSRENVFSMNHSSFKRAPKSRCE